MTMVKICGCRTTKHALTAKAAGADFIGMVFAESRRTVSRAEAAEIVQAVGDSLPKSELEAGLSRLCAATASRCDSAPWL